MTKGFFIDRAIRPNGMVGREGALSIHPQRRFPLKGRRLKEREVPQACLITRSALSVKQSTQRHESLEDCSCWLLLLARLILRDCNTSLLHGVSRLACGIAEDRIAISTEHGNFVSGWHVTPSQDSVSSTSSRTENAPEICFRMGILSRRLIPIHRQVPYAVNSRSFMTIYFQNIFMVRGVQNRLQAASSSQDCSRSRSGFVAQLET